jgi:hypothetical protein
MARVTISREEAEDGLLPPVCALTGVRTDEVKDKQFLWQPGWVSIIALVAIPAYIIVSLMVRKTMKVQLPLVREKHGHWLWRQVVGVLALFAGVATLIGSGAAAGDPNAGPLAGWIALTGLGLFIAAIVLFAVLNHFAIRPAEITDDDITLVNVHQNFVDALEEDREAEDERYDRQRRRTRDRRKRDRYDDYDDRPRRARYDDDEDYEDDRPRRRGYDRD